MAEAGGAEPGKPPPVASLERALDQVCDFLSRAEQTARVRALVIEARRLRNVVGNWRSIAPDPDVREEMIARVLRLANDAEDVVSAERSSAGQEAQGASTGAVNAPPLRQDLLPPGPAQATGLRLGPGPHASGMSPGRSPSPGAALFLAGAPAEHEGQAHAGAGHGVVTAPAMAPGPERAGAGSAIPRVVDLSATLSSPVLVAGGSKASGSPALPVTIERVVASPAQHDAGVRDVPAQPVGSPQLDRGLGSEFPSPPSLVFDRVVPLAGHEVTVREVPTPPPPVERPLLDRSQTGSFASPPSLVFNRVVPPPQHAPGDARPWSGEDAFESPPSLHIEQVRAISGSRESPALLPESSSSGAITVRPLPMPDAVDPSIVMVHAPYSPQADAYRTLRRKLPPGSAVTIAVTSARPGEGKTSCAINLALALRETIRGKILLVEANIRAPSIAKVLRFEPPSCFMEQLQRHRDERHAPWVVVEQAAPAPTTSSSDESGESSDKGSSTGSRPLDPRLSLQTPIHILAVDPRSELPPMLDAVAFSAGIESLKRAGYSYIIIDTPPVLGATDMNVIADSVDGVILTSIVKKSTRKTIRQAIEQLRPAPVIGVVLVEL